MPENSTNPESEIPGPHIDPRYHPYVSRSMCEQLMEASSESATLDYKRKYDLPDKKAYLDLTKDIAGMSVKGGYILIGVENDGTLWLEGTEIDEARWDEADIRQNIQRYLPMGWNLALQFTISLRVK